MNEQEVRAALKQEIIDEVEKVFSKFYPRCSLRFEVHLAEHCNLNCKNCNHYSPLAQKKFLDLEEYERDCARLSELFHGEAERIILLGGEPLLCPYTVEAIRITRRAFPEGRIQLLTNGILLSTEEDEFWEVCRECRIEVDMTEYPIKFDYQDIHKKAEEKGVTCYRYNWRPKSMVRCTVSMEKICREEHNFAHCYYGNECVTLRNGRLYPCMTAAHIHHLKKFFGLDLPLPGRNGVDIYAVADGDELMRKIARPIPLCGHCDLSMSEYKEEWGPSQKERYDWLGFEAGSEDLDYLKKATSVYVFGTGWMGIGTAKWLEEHGIPARAMLATRDKQSAIPGLPVINITQEKISDPNGICLLALRSERTKIEVEPALSECTFRRIIPVYAPSIIEHYARKVTNDLH